MRLASAGQHRFNPHIDAGGKVGRAEVTGIGQQSSHFAESLWQRIQCRECGRELLFVIGRLDQVVSDHQHGVRHRITLSVSTAACAL